MAGVLPRNQFERFFEVLHQAGYQVIGPTLGEAAVVYGPLEGPEDLPRGYVADHGAGSYTLVQAESAAYFSHTIGPDSFKKFLYPPRISLFTVAEKNNRMQITAPVDEEKPMALLGMRACELKAVEVQDKVLLEGKYKDSIYQKRREQALLIAVNCQQATTNCFCTSMQSGPRVKAGFDLALTEIHDENHRFLIEAGSEKGRNIYDQLDLKEAGEGDLAAAEQVYRQAEESVSKNMPEGDLQQLLQDNLEHENWQTVAERCLACTNCTMVCPTCFCTSVEDVNHLDGSHERIRRHDSCFNAEFSYLGEGSVRQSTAARYRQWVTHKLANWHDQFDMSGCVGCGRCITWCPPGIDITEEVRALKEN